MYIANCHEAHWNDCEVVFSTTQTTITTINSIARHFELNTTLKNRTILLLGALNCVFFRVFVGSDSAFSSGARSWRRRGEQLPVRRFSLRWLRHSTRHASSVTLNWFSWVREKKEMEQKPFDETYLN